MGLLDDYLNEDKASATAKPTASSGLIDAYLNSGEPAKPKSNAAPNVPISGASEEESARINAEPKKQGGRNPRNSQLWEGIKSYPGNIINTTVENVKDAASTTSSGISDVFSNKPASGAGKVGLGLLSGLVALPGAIIQESVTKPVIELTGNERAGEAAGFVAGAGLPVGQAAKTVIKNLPKNVAMRELVDKITSGGRDPQALRDTVEAMKADPRIGPADTSPAVLSMAQKLFVTEGDQAKKYLFDTSKARMAGLPEDVTKAYDAAAGTPVNVVKKLNELSEASKKVGSEKINPALTAAGPVNTNATVEAIDAILKPGVMSKISEESGLPLAGVKKELAQIKSYLTTGDEVRTDAKDLHSFQAGLRRTGQALLKSSDGGSRELGKALMNVRNNLVNDIDAASGGKYKPALAEYRDEMHIADSFRMGYEGVFSNSKKMENMPEFTDKWFKSLTDNEKEAAREGARLAIKTGMGTSGNPSLAGTNLARSEYNRAKLETLFGKDETTKLLRDLENTRAIKNTDQKLIENSQTAMRMAGDQAVALPVKGEGGSVLNYALPIAAEYGTTMMGQPGIGAAMGMGALALKKAGSEASFKIKTILAKERNAQLAKYALPTQGPQRDELIQQLEAIANANAAPKQSILRKMTGIVNP